MTETTEQRWDGVERRVLIADDEPNIVASLQFLMRREGYRVEVAADGVAALDLVADFRPHLVLLDVAMPRLDGFSVVQRIRADHGPSVAIVMLTAKGQEAEKAKGVALGADLYVTKPFSTRDLVADVRRILDRVGGVDEPAAASGAEDADGAVDPGGDDGDGAGR